MERPYRSHLQPACLACRRRKSRCRLQNASNDCLMCQVHGTLCHFPLAKQQSTKVSQNYTERNDRPIELHAVHADKIAKRVRSQFKNMEALDSYSKGKAIIKAKVANHATESASTALQDRPHTTLPRSPNLRRQLTTVVPEASSYTPQVGEADQTETPHIVGPMATNDENTLRQYLVSKSGTNGTHTIHPMTRFSSGESRSANPVLFRTISKRPIGVNLQQSPGRKQHQIIEKLIEPHAGRLIDLFFEYVNPCFPVLDEDSFQDRCRLGSNDNISPALMACIFAHAMILWPHTLGEEGHRCPDTRFIWVQAEDAIHAEQQLSPGLSTVVGLLLDIGGRPTTSMLGNAINIGAVVSLCYALGLNRNPLSWSIPEKEKSLRIRLWWSLLIHDRWCSLAYGTPPHIHRSQCDVPLPLLVSETTASTSRIKPTYEMFYYLSTLTEILGECLEYVYRLDEPDLHHLEQNKSLEHIKSQLEDWEKSVDPAVKYAILQDTKHDLPGAANLRLAYLSLRMHIQRIALDKQRSGEANDIQHMSKLRDLAQDAAEEIVGFVDKLEAVHIHGFWHPVSAFSLASTCTLLIRCAIESLAGESHHLYQSRGVMKANELVTTLKSYKERYSWDIGDICISQCEKVVDELLNRDSGANREEQTGMVDDIDFDALIAEELFPSVWDLVDLDHENEFRSV